MRLHESTFDYLRPSDQQMAAMTELRMAARDYADQVARMLPDGADKTYILRRIRETAMWVNVAITRDADGSPRIEI